MIFWNRREISLLACSLQYFLSMNNILFNNLYAGELDVFDFPADCNIQRLYSTIYQQQLEMSKTLVCSLFLSAHLF